MFELAGMPTMSSSVSGSNKVVYDTPFQPTRPTTPTKPPSQRPVVNDNGGSNTKVPSTINPKPEEIGETEEQKKWPVAIVNDRIPDISISITEGEDNRGVPSTPLSRAREAAILAAEEEAAANKKRNFIIVAAVIVVILVFIKR